MAVGGAVTLGLAALIGPFAMVKFGMAALRIKSRAAAASQREMAAATTGLTGRLIPGILRLRQFEQAATGAAASTRRLAQAENTVGGGGLGKLGKLGKFGKLGGIGLALSAINATGTLLDDTATAEEKGGSIGNLAGGLAGAAAGAALGSFVPIIGTALGGIIGGGIGAIGGQWLGGTIAAPPSGKVISTSAVAASVAAPLAAAAAPPAQINSGGNSYQITINAARAKRRRNRQAGPRRDVT